MSKIKSVLTKGLFAASIAFAMCICFNLTAEASVKNVIKSVEVTNKKELTKALKDKEVVYVILRTSAEEIEIPAVKFRKIKNPTAIDYEKCLIIDSPNTKVTNNLAGCVLTRVKSAKSYEDFGDTLDWVADAETVILHDYDTNRNEGFRLKKSSKITTTNIVLDGLDYVSLGLSRSANVECRNCRSVVIGSGDNCTITITGTSNNTHIGSGDNCTITISVPVTYCLNDNCTLNMLDGSNGCNLWVDARYDRAATIVNKSSERMKFRGFTYQVFGDENVNSITKEYDNVHWIYDQYGDSVSECGTYLEPGESDKLMTFAMPDSTEDGWDVCMTSHLFGDMGFWVQYREGVMKERYDEITLGEAQYFVAFDKGYIACMRYADSFLTDELKEAVYSYLEEHDPEFKG